MAVLDEGQKKLKAPEEAFQAAAVIQEARASNRMGFSSGPVSLPMVTGGAGVVGAYNLPCQFGNLRTGDDQPAP